jgi:hypothetical protein
MASQTVWGPTLGCYPFQQNMGAELKQFYLANRVRLGAVSHERPTGSLLGAAPARALCQSAWYGRGLPRQGLGALRSSRVSRTSQALPNGEPVRECATGCRACGSAQPMIVQATERKHYTDPQIGLRLILSANCDSYITLHAIEGSAILCTAWTTRLEYG